MKVFAVAGTHTYVKLQLKGEMPVKSILDWHLPECK